MYERIVMMKQCCKFFNISEKSYLKCHGQVLPKQSSSKAFQHYGARHSTRNMLLDFRIWAKNMQRIGEASISSATTVYFCCIYVFVVKCVTKAIVVLRKVQIF